MARYRFKATSQTHVELCSFPVQTCTHLEILSTLNSLKLHLYNLYLCLVHDENPFVDKSVYLLASCGTALSLVTSLGAENLDKIRLLDMHLIGSMCTHES